MGYMTKTLHQNEACHEKLIVQFNGLQNNTKMVGKLIRFRMPWSWKTEFFGKVFFLELSFSKLGKQF
jgi:hypothetical protein